MCMFVRVFCCCCFGHILHIPHNNGPPLHIFPAAMHPSRTQLRLCCLPTTTSLGRRGDGRNPPEMSESNIVKNLPPPFNTHTQDRSFYGEVRRFLRILWSSSTKLRVSRSIKPALVISQLMNAEALINNPSDGCN